MKKKIYFITSAIIQIICALNVLLSVDEIMQTFQTSITQMYAMFPADFQARVFNMIMNAGPRFIIFTSIASIIVNIVILVISIQDKLLKKKGLIIALSVIGFFTSINTINSLLSLVNFIVILCCKRKNPEDFPEKKEIPKLEYEKSSAKEIILGIILVVIYFSQFIIHRLLPNDLPLIANIGITVGFYLVVLAAVIFVFKDRYKRDLKLFKENIGAYFGFIIPRFAILYIIFIVVSLASILIAGQGISKNQETLEALPLWFSFPAAVLWAPIVEEAIFRGVLRRFIKNNIVFIIISAIIFGLLHTIGNESTIFTTIIMSFPYMTLGAFLAYIYTKTENICTNTFCHFFQNLLAMTLSTLLFFII
ncbi:MAG: CPBP family intramembrane metalloprotease [Clostridia bacterium]|nr:CPBP family intramembrane metalloprotease [Clostridia bacterium]